MCQYGVRYHRRHMWCNAAVQFVFFHSRIKNKYISGLVNKDADVFKHVILSTVESSKIVFFTFPIRKCGFASDVFLQGEIGTNKIQCWNSLNT